MTWTVKEGSARRIYRGTLADVLAFVERRRALGVVCEVCS